MFTRLALSALTEMSGRLWRRSTGRPRPAAKPAKPGAARKEKTGSASVAAGATEPRAHPVTELLAGAAPEPKTEELPVPEDHFRHQRPRTSAPPVAAVAARSLPLLGLAGAVLAVVFGIGAAQGELPGIGVVSDANLAWAALLVTISIWAVYLLWKVPQWQADAWARSGDANPRELFEIENQSRGTLGQILSGVAVLTGLIFAWQQLGQTSDNLRVSSEGQITDRFTNAVDQLGSDALTVRLGGIFALERIARDSPRDYGPVMEVLTAFARQESPLPVGAAGTPVAAAATVPEEVRAVFKVIGRRTEEQIVAELASGGCLDLTDLNAVGVNLIETDLRNTCWDRSDLRGAQIMRADLTGASFVSSNLSQQANLDGVQAAGAVFSQADLSQANLSRANFSDVNLLAANLSFAQLDGSDLDGANLVRADLSNALAFGADFAGADLSGANLSGTVLSGAQLREAEHLSAEQLTAAVVDGTTTLPEGMDAAPDS